MGGAVSTLLAQAIAWFKSQGWPAEVLKKGAVVRLSVSTPTRQWQALAQVFEKETLFVFLTIVARSVPRHREAAVLEWANQINTKLWLGNFQLEAIDGVVLFRTSLDSRGTSVAAEAFGSTCLQNLATAERFAGSLEQVLAGGEPQAAVEATLRKR